MYRYFKKISNTDHVSAWKSKGLSDESTKSPAASNNILAPSWDFIEIKTRKSFKVDTSSSVHVDKKKKYILIFGEGPKKRLDDTTSTGGKSSH